MKLKDLLITHRHHSILFFLVAILTVIVGASYLEYRESAAQVATIGFRASTTGENGGSSSFTLNKPSGTAAGDVLIAHLALNTTSPSVTAPSGWTLIRRTTHSSSLASAIYYKVAGSSEPSSYRWNFSSSLTADGGIAAYTNVDTSNPIDAHSGQANAGTNTMRAPSVTTTRAGARLLFISGVTSDSSVTGPSGMTRRWSVGSSSLSFVADKALTSTGATGDVTASNDSDESNVAHLVALRPQLQATPTTAPTSVPPTAVPTSGPAPTAGPSPTPFPQPPPPAGNIVKAINFNGSQVNVDGLVFQAEASAGVTYPSPITRFSKQTIPLNPAVSANKAQMIRESIWRGSSIQLLLDVAIPNNKYNVYLYGWEDTESTTYNIGFEGKTVAADVTSGQPGMWRKLGPYKVTVADGNLSLFQTGGDFNLSGMEVYTETPPPTFSTITYRSSNTADNGESSSLTISKPSGTVSGDVMIAHIVLNNTSPTITAPSGWTLIRRNNTSNTNMSSAIFYKVAGGSEPSSYRWTFNTTVGANGGIATYSGVDPNDPIDAHSGQYNGGTNTMRAPSVTTTTPADRLLFIGAVTSNSNVTGPSGMTQRWRMGDLSLSYLADRALTSAGATGEVTATNDSDESNIAHLVALNPITTISLPATPIPTATPYPGNVANLNFFLTNYNPWIQTVCGDFRDDVGLDNPVPAGQSMMVTNATCNAPGVVYTGDLTGSFGQGQASSSNQVVGGHVYPEVYTASESRNIFSSYAYLSAKAQAIDTPPSNLSSFCTLTNCTLPVSLPEGVYIASGDVTLNAYTFPVNQDFVILVDGNLTIRGNLNTPVNSSAVIATSGNIVIPETVGVAPTAATTNLSGIFITDKSFIIESTDTCADLRLNLAGTLIVNANRSGGSLQNNRDLCGANLNNPALQITQRLDFVLNLPEFMRVQSIISNEVAP